MQPVTISSAGNVTGKRTLTKSGTVGVKSTTISTSYNGCGQQHVIPQSPRGTDLSVLRASIEISEGLPVMQNGGSSRVCHRGAGYALWSLVRP